MHCVVSIANNIEESKTEFCHWEKRSPLRQMKKAEFVTPPRRVYLCRGIPILVVEHLPQSWLSPDKD
ncbi:hypothetical protein AVEN_112717-1 [Araneus ventricosus]|uniref:Uncharacterized protein n=1 Tax=Araneus ventricosus TaxID=182803 RepID=A0A4Y2PMH6_ARAVE|nr:hypothetical protein AVEN_112717-1 [Araneus ventricosus]